MHCITKNHLLCMFFEFVTCCVYVKYVSLTAVKVFGENQHLPDFMCFHGVLYLSI